MNETRTVNAIIGAAGGTAGKTSLTYKISIPSVWAQALKITKEDRALKISFDGKKIVIERKEIDGVTQS